mgnify:CR=1 FL=1
MAGPVYGGRLPSLMVERLAPFCGKDTLAVTAVVYGNRAFEDALLELNDCVKAQGFRVAASAALVAEHSMVPSVAHGRPDGQDLEQLHQFAGRSCASWKGNGQSFCARAASLQRVEPHGGSAAGQPGLQPVRLVRPAVPESSHFRPGPRQDRCSRCFCACAAFICALKTHAACPNRSRQRSSRNWGRWSKCAREISCF